MIEENKPIATVTGLYRGTFSGLEPLTKDTPLTLDEVRRNPIFYELELEPDLEDTDLIVEIGDWVVDAAVDQLASWLGSGFRTNRAAGSPPRPTANPRAPFHRRTCMSGISSGFGRGGCAMPIDASVQGNPPAREPQVVAPRERIWKNEGAHFSLCWPFSANKPSPTDRTWM